MLFDIIQQRCISFVCPPGYQVFGTNCIRKVTTSKISYSHKPDFEQCLTAHTPSLFIFLRRKKLNSSEFIKQMFSEMHNTPDIIVTYEKNETIIQIKENNTLKTLKYILSPYANPFTRVLQHIDRFVMYSVADPILKNIKNFDMPRSFPQNKLCVQPILLNMTVLVFNKNCSVKLEGKLIEASDMSMWVSVSKYGTAKFISSCPHFYMHFDYCCWESKFSQRRRWNFANRRKMSIFYIFLAWNLIIVSYF